jgi:5-methylcytosine-specific restriction protein A
MFNFLTKKIRFAQRSPRWSDIRNEHIKKYPKCAACGTKKNLEVHHIVPVHIDSSKELDVTNLITLCSNRCHLIFGHFMDYKSWNKDVEHDCAVYYNKLKNKP